MGRLKTTVSRYSAYQELAPRRSSNDYTFRHLALTPGTRLGVYDVTAQIGEGGMGAVYRAIDTTLGRQVAIKVLPDAFASDADRLARFEREARTLASLNHPNVAVIYAVEKSGGTSALVMELVEGEDLSQRIAHGPMPLDEALPIAKQVAEALEAAHEAGIVHRDLKPANIKVREDGAVKVLDFGLAKATERGSANGGGVNPSRSPTMTSPAMTQAGVILGTAAYMAPEQAKGRAVDKRADLWAFGCVLYEMVTGRRAFQPARGADASDVSGDTVAETLAAVLTQEPNWSALPASTPAPIRRLLRRCLEKDRHRRMPDAAAARLEIEDALSGPSADVAPIFAPTPAARSASSPVPSRASSRVIPWIVAAAASVAAGALSIPVVRHLRETPGTAAVVRLTATPTGTLAFAGLDAANDPDLAIAPDGRRIVYVNESTAGGPASLFVRNLGELEAKPLVSNAPANLRSPFISPDSMNVGFFDSTGVLRKVPIDGGSPVVVVTAGRSPSGASWGDDGAIVFATIDRTTGLLRVASGGGEPEVLTKPDASRGELDHMLPEVLPGSRSVLFTVAPTSPDKRPSIAVLDLATREQKMLVEGGSNPHYLASGHLLYTADGSVHAVRFDAARLETVGASVPVLEGVMTKTGGGTAAVPAVNATVSKNGTLAYVAGDAQGALRSVTWVDSSGREEPLGAPVRAYAYARLSPDERRIALDIRDQQNDIWTWDVARKTMTRLTFAPGFNRGIAWTPDSRRLAFSSQHEGSEDVYWQAADGTGAAERLTDGPGIKVPTAISPDGTRLFFGPATPPYDIGMVSLGLEHRIDWLMKTPFDEQDPELSPDGRWLAYWSNESGRDDVFVRPFPNVDEGKWQVSTAGGSAPLWSRDGRWLYYWVGARGAGQGRVMRVAVHRVPKGFASGTPELVVEGPYLHPHNGRSYDVARDGRILVIKDALIAPTTPNQLVVVLNWFEELKRMLPVQ